ncbi:MAG: hypothetical protein U9R57_04450 [Thermodesulfobacteriota bacterium]|nr:hypothetical protein [Thermodesulfobacteriota bacterium]
MRKNNIISCIQGTINHQRGDTALYDAVDAIFLPLVAMIGGARSISGIVKYGRTVFCAVLPVGLVFRMKRHLVDFFEPLSSNI